MVAANTSVRELVSKSERAIETGNIDAGLRLVHDFVERIVTEPVCAAMVFASHPLDEVCIVIGRASVAKLGKRLASQEAAEESRSTVVYLVSRLQPSGGHSRLVQDFIRLQPEHNHLIVSTEVGGPSDKKFYSELFANATNVSCIYASSGNFEARLRWVQSTLLSIQPAHVYLFNHHQDSVAVAALVPELNLKGSFCHHGDHHLCLGVHLRHLTHLDFHPMGFHYCRDELGLENRYLPLTFEDKGCRLEHTNFSQSGMLTTATAARSNKVEIPYYVSYLDTIPRVLKATGGRHVHIGKLTPWGLRRIHRLMRKARIPRDRFIYIEWTASVWKALEAHKVDVYIASFPYGAGLTLIEAMGAGIPVVMHQHMFSRVLSGLELAYPEAFSWAGPEELLNYLANLQPDKLMLEKKLARSRYEEFHQPDTLKAYFKNPDSLQLPTPPLSREFKPRYDEWAAWAETQLSFKRLLYRFAYRKLRGLRLRLT